ncbi:MAG: DNA-protecting protein DprA [Burkholderiales bacterium]|nr:MAG: DNA-protecting protein DprA [Burkholderiales bacterium]
MTREELGLWLRLSAAEGVGSLTATRLLKAFGLPDKIFSQNEQALSVGLKPAQVNALLSPSKELPALIEANWNWLSSTDGAWRTVVSLADSNYPKALLQLPDPPILLYVTGARAVYEHIAAKEAADDIAIVGSRNATPQGLGNARSFAKAFAQSGMHIVSGLALGIDGAAHEGALDAQHDFGSAAGSTVAVVGTGLDRVYPKRHHDLAHRIVQHGLIISEFPIGTPPLAENFPRRNRIIAALTQGTLVVEAAIQSGSLITARQALDLGKDVFAIPGSIHSPQAKGCHHLIKQGAKLVESAQDVIEELPIKPSTQLAHTMISGALRADSMPACGSKDSENASEDPLLDALGHDPISLDALIDRTGIPAAQLQVQLLEWELLGEVARLPGGLFQRMAQA